MTERAPTKVNAAYWQSILEQVQLQSDEWGFVSAYGTGDTYFIATLARQFSQTHGGKVVMIGTAPHCQVAGMFPAGVSRVVAIDRIDRRAVDQLGARRPGGLFVAHPAHDRRRLFRKLGGAGYRMVDMYREYLGLPPNAQLDKPTIPHHAIEEARKELARAKLPPGRTAVLAPVTRSVPMIEFPWMKLVAGLKQHGWSVATNVAEDETPIRNTTALRCSLRTTVPLLDQAGWLIAMRSGLCDVASTSSCHMSVLYPRFRWYSGSLLDATSIKQMGLHANTIEYEIAPTTNKDRLVDRLVEEQISG